MDFFDNQYFRKVPVNLLTDGATKQAEQLLPRKLHYAPALVYLAGLKYSDQEGIFDIGNGRAFADAAHLWNDDNGVDLATLKLVLDAMVEMRIFAHVPESSVYLFADWDYNGRSGDKSIYDRYALACAVWKNHQLAASFFSPSADVKNTPSNVSETPSNVSKTPSNVSQTPFDRKDKIRIEKIIQDETRKEEIRKDTHTEEKRQEREEKIRQEGEKSREEGASAPSLEREALRSSSPKEEQRLNLQKNEKEEKKTGDTVSLAAQALTQERAEEINEKSSQTYSVFVSYFAKNCLGFEENQHKAALQELARRTDKLGTQGNPPKIVASVLINQFQKLLTENDYYKDYPVTPEDMAADNIWKRLLSASASILIGKEEKPPAWEAQITEAELTEANNAWNAEYTKYGIDPNSDTAFAQLMQKKKEVENV